MARPNLKNRHTMAMEVFSTIASPVFSELVVVLDGEETPDLSSDLTFFETLCKMNELRPFKLVFSFDFRSSVGEEAGQRVLVEALDRLNAEGLLDFLASPFTIR